MLRLTLDNTEYKMFLILYLVLDLSLCVPRSDPPCPSVCVSVCVCVCVLMVVIHATGFTDLLFLMHIVFYVLGSQRQQ